jgi:hypothetical protein
VKEGVMAERGKRKEGKIRKRKSFDRDYQPKAFCQCRSRFQKCLFLLRKETASRSDKSFQPERRCQNKDPAQESGKDQQAWRKEEKGKKERKAESLVSGFQIGKQSPINLTGGVLPDGVVDFTIGGDGKPAVTARNQRLRSF